MQRIGVWLLATLLILQPVGAQTFQRELATIPVVRDGGQLAIPWNGGLHTLSISIVDIDGDTDKDLIVTGKDEWRLQFYRNDGSGASGSFTFADTTLGGIILPSGDNRIAFLDFDNDNDLDLFVGGTFGRIAYYRNDGSPSAPLFTLVTSFFDSIEVPFSASPAFGDLNGDSRLDLVSGSFNTGLFYYQRTASGSPAFVFADTLRDTSGAVINPGGIFLIPALADIDDDNDLDLFVSSSDGSIAFYRNIGSPTTPAFALVTSELVTPSAPRTFTTPVFADIDNDGDVDLFFGSNEGHVTFFLNSGTPVTPAFTEVTHRVPLDFLDFDFYAQPILVDIDNDGDLDLFSGSELRGFHFLRNTGTPSVPQFEHITDQFSGVQGGLTYTWGDLDNDGDLDLLSGLINGSIVFYRNVGTPTVPQLDSTGLLRDTALTPVLGRRPLLVDVDGDGDLDLLVARFTGGGPSHFFFYRNKGTPTNTAFVFDPDTLRDQTGEAISSFDPYFTFADIDNDGDLDFFLGISDGMLRHYLNTGTATSPSFELSDPAFGGVHTGSGNRCIPAFADIDNDGDLDLFIGRFMGGFFFYRNLGATDVVDRQPSAPAGFHLSQNYPNPFNPMTTITYSVPGDAHVSIVLYDVLGRVVRTLVDGAATTGIHHVSLDGSDLATGVYLYRLRAGGFTQTRKLTIMR